MKTIKELLYESKGKLKLIPGINLQDFKYFDVCVYDTFFKNWQCTYTDDDLSKLLQSYDEAEQKANEIIDEGYYKGILIIASNDGKTWKDVAKWGRQKFRNDRH